MSIVQTTTSSLTALILLTAISGFSNIWASSLSLSKTWASGETLNATDLNQNFTDVKTAVDDNDTRIGSKQDRITGTCPAGSSISSVQADGSVICQSATITNSTLRIFLQDGLNNYTGTTDTTLYKVPVGFNPTPGTFSGIYSENQADAATGMLALIRFEMSTVMSIAQSYAQQFDSTFALTDCDAQITVNNVQLQLFSKIGGGTAGTSTAYLLRYFKSTAPVFNEVQADWTNASLGQPWSKSGAPIEIFNDIDPNLFEATDLPTSSYSRKNQHSPVGTHSKKLDL